MPANYVWALVQIHVLLGQKEDVSHLDRYLLNLGTLGAGFIERHPLFDPPKNDPAFQTVAQNTPSDD
ncbi:MAG TPA: hypothetical protein VLK65_26030 [Vicinamibacteria bacterium]|nr:hypothetical protein [Vicinamibacteria bacterium]